MTGAIDAPLEGAFPGDEPSKKITGCLPSSAKGPPHHSNVRQETKIRYQSEPTLTSMYIPAETFQELLTSIVQTGRMNLLEQLPPMGTIVISNSKPKRKSPTAIKAREQQLVQLAEEALLPKQKRKVVHFLGYKDIDLTP